MEHVLKTWPAIFEMMFEGLKTFEIRKNDRGYQVGDVLRLCEYNPVTDKFSGRELFLTVSLMIQGEFGLPSDICVMQTRMIHKIPDFSFNEKVLTQPVPAPGFKEVLPFVLQDLRARAEMGKKKYGTGLETFNGRDALWDAYQEHLDLVMYLRQELLEREDKDNDVLKKND